MASDDVEKYLLNLRIPLRYLSQKNYEDLLINLQNKWMDVCGAMGYSYLGIQVNQTIKYIICYLYILYICIQICTFRLR